MWFLHVIGVTNASGRWYLLWSGVVGDLVYIGAFCAILHKWNCEQHGCPRIARHQTAAGHHVCRKHHPDGHLTADDILDAHNEAKVDQ